MRKLAGVLCSTVVAACALAPPAGAVDVYTALGDSYTSGPLIPNPTGEPIDCGRSDHNYPTLFASEISPDEFRDVSCGSAQTIHMTEPQTGLPLGGTNPPQFDALGERVDLVTLGIVGNDIGFGEIVETCARLALESGGEGQPCTDHYTAGGTDEIARRIGEARPKLAGVIAGIHRRSPDARLLVVGYPAILPEPPGCYPREPIAPGDLPYLLETADRLNAMIASEAEEAGGEYVDLYTRSVGHDICQPPGTKWYEGIEVTSPAYPAHPNALGMEHAAREVLGVFRRPIPNRFRILRRRGSRKGKITLRLAAPYRGSFRIKGKASTDADGRIRYASGRAFAERAQELRVRLRTRDDGRRALREARTLEVRVKVTFDPVGGTKRTKRTKVSVGR
jgi:hypothetical protein